MQRHHGDNTDCAFWGWQRAWSDPGFKAWDITDSLAHIRVPVLLIQGLADPYGTRAQADIAEEEVYCPIETVLLEGVGHDPFRDQKEATLDRVAGFVCRLETLLAANGTVDPSAPPTVTAAGDPDPDTEGPTA